MSVVDVDVSEEVQAMNTLICLCGLGFDNNSVYRTHKVRCPHVQSKTGDDTFVCTNCSEMFESEDMRKQHMIDVCHSANGGQYVCSLCDKILLGDTFLHSHFESQHMFHCPLCQEGSYWNFIPKLSFQQHMLHLHNVSKVELKGMERVMARIVIAPCPTCGKQFYKRYKLIKHFRELGHGRLFECSRCNMYAVNGSILKCHERTHTSLSLKYNCELCNSQFANKRALLMHIIQHDCPYRCSFCSEQSVHFAVIAQHVATHNSTIAFYENHCLDLRTKRKKLVPIDGDVVNDNWGAYKAQVFPHFATLANQDTAIVLSDEEDAVDADSQPSHSFSDAQPSESKTQGDRNKRSRISACHSYVCQICEKTFMSKKFFVSHMAWHSKGVSIKCQVLTPYFNVKETVDFVPSDITITLNGKSPNFTIRHRHEGDTGKEQDEILCDSGDEETGETLYYAASKQDDEEAVEVKPRRPSSKSQDGNDGQDEPMVLVGTARIKSEHETVKAPSDSDEDEDSIMIVGSSQPRKRVKMTNNKNNKKKLLLCNKYKCIICSESFIMKKAFVTHMGAHGQGKSIKCEVWTNHFNIKDKADFIPQGSFIALVLEPGTKDTFKVVLKQEADDEEEVVVAIDSDQEEPMDSDATGRNEVALNSGFTPIINDDNSREEMTLSVESAVEYAEIPIISNPHASQSSESEVSLSAAPESTVTGNEVAGQSNSSMSSSISLIQNATSLLLDPGPIDSDLGATGNLNPPVTLSSKDGAITGQTGLDQGEMGTSDVAGSSTPMGAFTSEATDYGALLSDIREDIATFTATTVADTPAPARPSQSAMATGVDKTSDSQSTMQEGAVITLGVARVLGKQPDNTMLVMEEAEVSESLSSEPLIDPSEIKQSPGAKLLAVAETQGSPLVIRQVRSLSNEGSEQLGSPVIDEVPQEQPGTESDHSALMSTHQESFSISREPSDEGARDEAHQESQLQIASVNSTDHPESAVFRIESIRSLPPSKTIGDALSDEKLSLSGGVIFSETPAEELTAEELESMTSVMDVIPTSDALSKDNPVPVAAGGSSGSLGSKSTRAPPSEQITETLEILAEMGEIPPVAGEATSAPSGSMEKAGSDRGNAEGMAVVESLASEGESDAPEVTDGSFEI